MTHLPPPPPLLAVAEVAERLSCSKKFVYKLLTKGQLRHYALGGGKRVSEEQLAAYLAGAERCGPATMEREQKAGRRRPREMIKLKHLRL